MVLHDYNLLSLQENYTKNPGSSVPTEVKGKTFYFYSNSKPIPKFATTNKELLKCIRKLEKFKDLGSLYKVETENIEGSDDKTPLLDSMCLLT